MYDFQLCTLSDMPRHISYKNWVNLSKSVHTWSMMKNATMNSTLIGTLRTSNRAKSKKNVAEFYSEGGCGLGLMRTPLTSTRVKAKKGYEIKTF